MSDATVRLMHYDPRWRQEFEQTKSGIFQSCQGDVVAIEHIGSTSIPGLIARPIIDLIAAVSDDRSTDECLVHFEGLYFRSVLAPTWFLQEDRLLVKPRHGEATHQVILTSHGSDTWQRVIGIRNHLLAVPEIAVRFEDTKVKRWKQSAGEADRYGNDKAIFFAHLEEQLRAQGGPLNSTLMP